MTNLGKITGFDLLRGPTGFDLALGDGCEACCEPPCDCTIRYLETVACESCAETNYPTTLATPRQVKISISGVGLGVNTAGPNYYNCCNPAGATCQQFFGEIGLLGTPACEANAMASQTGFFNADFTLDPCTNVNLFDCRYICSTLNLSTGIPYNVDYFEWSVLNLSYQADPSVLGRWFIGASLHSWVGFLQRPTAGTVCNAGGGPPRNNTTHVLNSPGTGSTGIYAWCSYRWRVFGFTLNAGTRTGWFYDPAYCTPECNSTIELARCLASGLSTSFPTLVQDGTCLNEKALDVNSASATVTIL